MLSIETQSHLNQLRLKAANGTITEEELAQGIAMIRKDRIPAAHASEGARTKRTAAKPNADDLLSQLEGL